MAKKPKPSRSSPASVVHLERGKDGALPSVAIDAGQVSAILEFRVVVAGELVFGTGLIEGDLERHPDLRGIGEAVAPEFRALMQAIAGALGAQVVDLGQFAPADGGPPTVVARGGGRA